MRSFDNRLRGLAAAMAAAALAPAFSYAQDDEPMSVPDERPPPAPSKSDPCKALHDPSIFDPDVRPTKNDENHGTIQNAICHAKPGGKVILHRDLYEPFLPGFVVNKPNLEISAADAADGGSIPIAQNQRRGRDEAERRTQAALGGSCVVIDPGPNYRADDAVTIMRGFTFIANGKSEHPCVYVKSGTLVLEQSDILLRNGGIAIKVAPTAKLVFTGSNPEEHGIFAEPDAQTAPGLGVVAGESKEIVIRGVRLSGLHAAVQSEARNTTIENVQFDSNDVGVEVTDAALRAAYAPNVFIIGGEFDGDATALKVSRTSYGPGGPGPSGDGPYPFRGEVVIRGDAARALKIASTEYGVRFDNAFPSSAFTIDNVRFAGQATSAVEVALPASAAATLNNVGFTAKNAAIKLNGRLDGSLTIGGASTMAGSGTGVAVPAGSGRFFATVASVSGLRPAFQIGRAWGGQLSLNVGNPKTSPEFMKFERGSAICGFDLGDKKKRDAFKRALGALKVTVDGRHISWLFGADSASSLSDRELLIAQEALCSEAASSAPSPSN